jgi:hypothetical protein
VAADNLVNQKVALHMLAQMGYHADTAANGRERKPSTIRLFNMDDVLI